MRINRLITTTTILSVFVVLIASPILSQGDHPQTQMSMRAIYGALTKCYAASLDARAFESNQNREEILLALRTISANAKKLEKHDELAGSFDFLQRSLARDARDAAKRYDERNYFAAKYILGNLTESCVSCHSKLPSGQSFDVGSEFINDARIQQIPPRDRARIEVAARQFDQAMSTYEKLIESAVMPEQVMMEGVFEDYFKLSLRVNLDTSRPSQTLRSFAERHELGSPLNKRVASWQKALKTAELNVAAGQEHARARAMIQSGRDANSYPQDRSGVVYFVAASSVLNRFFESKPLDGAKIAEAFYLLGIAESYISTSSWLSETEFYLTSAVDASPKSKYAQDAYDFLYDYVTNKYTGSSGVQIPLDVQDELDAVKGKLD